MKIVDLDSRNGIEVNGEKVREAVLRPGDSFLVGKTTFVLGFAT